MSAKPRRGLSIQQKLLALILVLVVGIVALLALYLPARQISAMRVALESKAVTYGRLVSKQVESAIAFDDQETAREVFESVAQDPDIESLTLFTARGDVLRSRGSLSPELASKKTGVTEPEVVRLGDRIAVVSPVVSLEGPRGTLVLELSMQRLVAEGREVQRNAALAGLLALILGAAGASFIARSLSRRLRAVAHVAEAVAAGDLDQKPADVGQSRDEIGTMATAFNAMLAQIRALVTQIRRSAQEEQERLEGLVQARTRELDGRNADMRRVLDNVGQGFFTLDREARMSRERSAILATWLGSSDDSESFIDVLTRISPSAGTWFALGWEALFEDVLPVEVCVDQLPKRVALGELTLDFAYRPILGENDAVERVLVVISDVTAELSRARAEADEREVTRLFARVFSDRAGFLEFFSEAHGLVERVVKDQRGGKDKDSLKHALHTLKGNVALYGLESVASICHHLEDELEEGGELSSTTLGGLRQRWTELATKVRALVGDSSLKIEIDDQEYRQILEAIQYGRPRREITEMIHAWRLEPTHTRLSRMAEQASALARRLGKAPIDVRIESNQIRMKPEEWAEFWAASVHVIRNAIDHGIETPDERRALGKPSPALLEFRTRLDDQCFSIEFQDSGRGITWENVAAKARALGMPSETRAELVEALFSDGFSTRDEANEMSGRGIGLAAVRLACTKLGGHVEVDTTPGVGSTFRFVWPAQVIRGRTSGAPSQRPISMSVGLRWASLPPSAE